MEVWTGKKPFIELTREELMKIKNQEAFIPIIYSEIVGLLKQKYGTEYAYNRIREMGHKLAEGLLKYWRPKNIKTIPDIIKEAYNFFLYRKIEVKKVGDKLMVRDQNCPVCYLDVSDSDIPFCAVFSAMIEGLVNGLRKWITKIPEIKCETVASRSIGSELCEHMITFV